MRLLTGPDPVGRAARYRFWTCVRGLYITICASFSATGRRVRIFSWNCHPHKRNHALSLVVHRVQFVWVGVPLRDCVPWWRVQPYQKESDGEPRQNVDFNPYAAWQKVLEEAFFSPAWDGHPVVMYLDDDEAAALQGQNGLEVPLVEAVRRVIRPDDPKPYESVEKYESSKHHDDHAPAVLPLLACSVIAATRMANDGVRRATNYHSHFAQLLGGTDGALTSAKYRAVAGMWQRLASWQHQWGAYRGICTIPSPGDLPHNQARIGFALSQAILRATDRQQLPKFFEAVRQHHGSAWPLPGAVLVDYLRAWGQAYHFSPGFRGRPRTRTSVPSSRRSSGTSRISGTVHRTSSSTVYRGQSSWCATRTGSWAGWPGFPGRARRSTSSQAVSA